MNRNRTWSKLLLHLPHKRLTMFVDMRKSGSLTSKSAYATLFYGPTTFEPSKCLLKSSMPSKSKEHDVGQPSLVSYSLHPIIVVVLGFKIHPQMNVVLALGVSATLYRSTEPVHPSCRYRPQLTSCSLCLKAKKCRCMEWGKPKRWL